MYYIQTILATQHDIIDSIIKNSYSFYIRYSYMLNREVKKAHETINPPSVPLTLNTIQCTLHWTLYSVYYTEHYTVYITLNTIQCTLHWTLYTVHYTEYYTVYITLYSVLILNTIQWTLHWTLYSVHYTVHYTEHYTSYAIYP